MGLPPSGSVWLHVRLAVKPAAWSTSSALAAGAAWTIVVRVRAAAAAAMGRGMENFRARRSTSLLLRPVRSAPLVGASPWPRGAGKACTRDGEG